ncbi:glycosyl transferase GT2 family [Apostichopus japonicus]|uniref:Glycosyl transferase GT2 family n=1 Tax=Stichopus japonicus TaxID=307972 RepID=A0A2G8JTG6_STIJA|nr:glycosyl transferase GT2 family [Apostichopus japonicus]
MTPLIKLEPEGLTFDKPAQLTIPHSAIIPEPDRHDVVIYTGLKDEENIQGEITWTEEKSIDWKLDPEKISLDITFLSYVFVNLVNQETEQKHIFRIVPFIDGILDVRDDVLITVCFCKDSDEEYKLLLEDHHSKLCLGNYTTFQITRTLNDGKNHVSYIDLIMSSPGGGYHLTKEESTKHVDIDYLCAASRVCHQFRLTRDKDGDTDMVDVKLKVFQNEMNQTALILQSKIQSLPRTGGKTTADCKTKDNREGKTAIQRCIEGNRGSKTTADWKTKDNRGGKTTADCKTKDNRGGKTAIQRYIEDNRGGKTTADCKTKDNRGGKTAIQRCIEGSRGRRTTADWKTKDNRGGKTTADCKTKDNREGKTAIQRCIEGNRGSKQQLTGRLKKQRRKKQQLTGRLKTTEEERQQFKDTLKTTEEEERQQLTGRLKTTEEERQQFKDTLKTTEEERQQLIRRLKTTEEERQQFKDTLKTTEEERQQLTGRLKTTEEERQQFKDTMKTTEEERKQLIGRLKTTEEERQQLTGRLKTTEEERQQLTARLKTTEEERQHFRDGLNTTENKLKTLKNEHEEAKYSLRATKDELVKSQLEYAKESMALQEVLKQTREALNQQQLAYSASVTEEETWLGERETLDISQGSTWQVGNNEKIIAAACCKFPDIIVFHYVKSVYP